MKKKGLERESEGRRELGNSLANHVYLMITLGTV